MCNCNKNKSSAQPRRMVQSSSTTQEFSLVSRDGSVQKFGSRLEADAANVRAGYTGIVKPVGA